MAKKLKVSFLGGVGEIGKNMTAIEYGDNILIVDCGSAFPTNDTPGIDLVIPDFNYITQNKDKVRAILLTHGHEDHIGGMPFLIKELQDVKVYGSKLTLALLEHKLKERRIDLPKMTVVEGGARESIGCFNVEFIKNSHSISGALSLSISTPLGVIFHTGDYKIDYTPIDGDRCDLARLGQIGNNGVLLMLGESTNIEKEGYSMSESNVGATFDKLFAEYSENRLIIATFASNVHRLQQIIDMSKKYGRKVILNGRSMKKIGEMAKEIGELKYDDGDVIDVEQMKKHPHKKLCIISTGSQGEPMSALTRMSSGDDKISVCKGDVVILSSSPIPGNERYIYNVINNLYRRGAKVLYGGLEDLHASGHACKEELKLMLTLLRPQLFVPIHGEFRHLRQHAELANKLGVDFKNIQLAEIGTQLEVRPAKLVQLPGISAGNVYVDGLMDVDSVILRDRTHLSKDGFVVALMPVSIENRAVQGQIEIIGRGLQFTDEIVEAMRVAVTQVISDFDYKGMSDRNNLKAKIKRQINRIISERLQQRPMVLPIIMEV